MATPNYILKEDHIYAHGTWNTESKILPGGSFVRPIEWCYVPQHVKDNWIGFDQKTHVFAYTRRGILPLPRNKVVRV